MPNNFRISDATLFLGNVMLGMKKMKAELNEHRHFLERSVERETAYLSKRIALLESCNATLSGKLALAYQEIVMLERSARDSPRSHDLKKDIKLNGSIVKLRVMNNQTKTLTGANIQEKRGERVTAA